MPYCGTKNTLFLFLLIFFFFWIIIILLFEGTFHAAIAVVSPFYEQSEQRIYMQIFFSIPFASVTDYVVTRSETLRLFAYTCEGKLSCEALRDIISVDRCSLIVIIVLGMKGCLSVYPD